MSSHSHSRLHDLAYCSSRLLAALTAATLLGACADPAHDVSTPSPREQRVVRLLKALETRAEEPLSIINPTHYTQHNLLAEDGLAGLRAFLGALPPDSLKVNTVRVFEDGDFVFSHTGYEFFGPKAGFDLYRFEDGRIVEHWDNLEETPVNANASGRTMLDGPMQVMDLDRTAANKQLVASFAEDVLVQRHVEKVADYFDGDRYLQHSPRMADGVSSLRTALQDRARVYVKVHRVLGEGNFVLLVSEGRRDDQPLALFEMFRVENGKLAEHWETLEFIPAREQWKNSNGKF